MLDFVLLALVLIMAPVPFWVAGLPWFVRARPEVLRLAPVAGLGLIGLFAEIGMMAGIGAGATVLIVLGLSGAFLVVRGMQVPWTRVATALREGYLLYLLALVPATVSPFPVLGTWSGDWLYLYDAGRTVWLGGRFSPETLERPPLSGATAVPLWLIRDGLPSYQIACAVASAAALGAALATYTVFGGRRKGWLVLVPLAGSVFFLHHTAACWGKLFAAAAILAALTLFRLARRDDSWAYWWGGAFFFALAVAVHHSSIIYFGFVLVAAFFPGEKSVKAAAARVGAVAAAGLLVVVPYETWSIATYGLETKAAVNPSIAQRKPGTRAFVVNTVLVGVSSLVPWSPVQTITELTEAAAARNGSEMTKKLYWVVTDYLTVSAGTFLGLILPFVPLLWSKPVSPSAVPSPHWAVWTAVALAFLLNAVLNPYYSAAGTLQTGLTPLGMVLLMGLLLQTDRFPERAARLVAVLTVILGLTPFVLVNGSVAAGLKWSAAFRARFEAGSEGDWTDRIVPRQLEPLGLAGFPWLPLVVLACLILMNWRSTTAPRIHESTKDCPPHPQLSEVAPCSLLQS